MDIFKAYHLLEFASNLKQMKIVKEYLVQISRQEGYNGRIFSNKTYQMRKYF